MAISAAIREGMRREDGAAVLDALGVEQEA